MKEITGNMFDLMSDGETDSICITTNGIIGNDGRAIMGAGCAGEAARRWPTVRKTLGKALKAFGNLPYVIGMTDPDGNFQDTDAKLILDKKYQCLIWSFPTKGDFRYKSLTDLIVKSAKLMVEHADKFELKKIVMPRPGCSNGKLEWSEVKKLIEPILDDRFFIVSFESEKE